MSKASKGKPQSKPPNDQNKKASGINPPRNNSFGGNGRKSIGSGRPSIGSTVSDVEAAPPSPITVDMTPIKSHASAAEDVPATDKIKVSVRIRPMVANEVSASEVIAWNWENNVISSTAVSKKAVFSNNDEAEAASDRSFAYDHLFTPESQNQQIFETVVKNVVNGAMNGYHGSVFSYGQTSSGKTFTMNGGPTQPGIIPQAIYHCFESVNAYPDREFLIRVSYLEVYNEQIKDLLAVEPVPIKIQHDPKLGTVLSGVKEQVVLNPQQVIALIRSGEAHRHVGSTDMNEKSSRAHTLFKIIVESKLRSSAVTGTDTPVTGAAADPSSLPVKVSTLNLVDLAGSESARMTNSKGERLREAKHINQSLLTLSTIIQRLSEDRVESSGAIVKKQHLPYRDSKLTRLLESALDGNALISIICTISPAQRCYEETVNTLKFASRAKLIKMAAKVNETVDDKTLLRAYREEIEHLKAKLRNLEEQSKSGPSKSPMARAPRPGGVALMGGGNLLDDFLREGGALAVDSETASVDGGAKEEEEQTMMLQMIVEMERLILKADNSKSNSNMKRRQSHDPTVGSSGSHSSKSASPDITEMARKSAEGISKAGNSAEKKEKEPAALRHTGSTFAMENPGRKSLNKPGPLAIAQPVPIIGSPSKPDHKTATETKEQAKSADQQKSGSKAKKTATPPAAPHQGAAKKPMHASKSMYALPATAKSASVDPSLPPAAPSVRIDHAVTVVEADDGDAASITPTPAEASPGLAEKRSLVVKVDSVEQQRDKIEQKLPAVTPSQVKRKLLSKKSFVGEKVEIFEALNHKSSEDLRFLHHAQSMPLLRDKQTLDTMLSLSQSDDWDLVNTSASAVVLDTPTGSSLPASPLVSQIATKKSFFGKSPRATAASSSQQQQPVTEDSIHPLDLVNTTADSDSDAEDEQRNNVLYGVSKMLMVLKGIITKPKEKEPAATGAGNSGGHKHHGRPSIIRADDAQEHHDHHGRSNNGSSLINESFAEEDLKKAKHQYEQLKLDLRLKEADNRFLQEELENKDKLLNMLTEGLKEVEVSQNQWLTTNQELSTELEKALWQNKLLRQEVHRLRGVLKQNNIVDDVSISTTSSSTAAAVVTSPKLA